jgi:hypothetical protein
MKTALTIILFFLSFSVYAQTFRFFPTDNIHNQLRLNTRTGEVMQMQNDGQTFLIHPATTPNNEISNRYMLYGTQNMWTFILLDTFTGRLWQCQFSIRGSQYRASWIINSRTLSTNEFSQFIIQPMTSMFQFLLINEETGERWRFQWSTRGSEYRWIERF